MDHLEGLVDLITESGSSEDNLPADKDQQDNLGLDHAVDQAREQLGLVGAEVAVASGHTLEADGKADIARSDNILDLEGGELSIEAELLDDARTGRQVNG